MMMRMLEAAGISPMTDNIRRADEDNPRGYYEFERVKELPSDSSWVPEARGKAVKVISALLRHLPAGESYKVLFMRRRIGDVLASQKQMLVRRGKADDGSDDERMAALFAKHVSEVEAAIAQTPGFEVLYVAYEDVIADPAGKAAEIAAFLDSGSGIAADADAMVGIVEPALHRQQGGS